MKKQEKSKGNFAFLRSMLVPALLLTVTVVFIAVYYTQVRGRSIERAFDEIQTSADNQASSLSMTLEGQFIMLETGARGIGMSKCDMEQASKQLDSLFTRTDYWEFFITDSNGIAYGSTVEGSTDISARGYFKKSMEGSRALERITNARFTDDARVMFSVPVYREGKVIGVLLCSVIQEYFKYGLDMGLYDKNGYALVCDGNGDIIIGSEKLPEGSSNMLTRIRQAEFSYGSFEEVESALAEKRGGNASCTINGKSYYSVYRPLGINDWFIFSVMPEEKINAEVQSSTFGGMLILLAVMAIAIVLNVLVGVQAQKNERQKKSLAEIYQTIPCGIIQYTFEENPHIISCNDTCRRLLCFSDDVSYIGMEYTALSVGRSTDFLAMRFLECLEADERISYIFSYKQPDGTERFFDCTLERKPTPNVGSVYMEVFTDATERVKGENEAEEQYFNELQRRGMKENGLLYTTCLNITRNTIIETDLLDTSEWDIPLDTFFSMVVTRMEEFEDSDIGRSFFDTINRNTLLERYVDGKLEYQVKHRMLEDGRIIWVNSEFNLRRNPTSGDIIVFIYTWDINDDEVRRIITSKLTENEFLFFAQLNALTEDISIFGGAEDGARLMYNEGGLRRRFADKMKRADAEEFLKLASIPCIMASLDDNNRYRVYAVIYDENGKRSDLALTYFYTDYSNKLIALTVSDVTEVRREEVERAELIRNALETAESASRAKGTFLSQMSHEIRTPLNAIIGYLSLAEDASDNLAALTEYIKKSTIASKHLLSLINDVLDMSSIESGKLKIAHEEFDLQHLLSTVTTVFYTQAQSKGLNFSVTLNDVKDEWLIGDPLRFSQIMMNLLSNAVKFTPSGGSVSFDVTQLGVVADKVQLRVTISDTGVGISEEYIARLFRPFEQQDASTARKFGGSGLGLSITKNLITLMGGQIEVESHPGEGTKFYIMLSFDKSLKAASQEKAEEVNYDFSKLRALVIDDLEQDRLYIKSLFKRCGVRCDAVESGSEGIHQIERRIGSSHPYDLCIIDWNMPEMDGLEATEKIRAIAGDKLPIICATAYDTAAIKKGAENSGVDSVISKPLFQSTIFDLLVNTFGQYKPKNAEKLFDIKLSGTRLLLVEDNEMNTDIAKRYLNKAEIEVECAINGEVAFEKFRLSPENYYDAILMDIQMPIMDGYEATKRIRAAARPDAKETPIIAMTANAFSEDVTAALAAGMNDHIAKPIDYEKLMAALQKHAKPRTEKRLAEVKK